MSEEEQNPSEERPRPQGITPHQRRLLGRAPSRFDEKAKEEEQEEPAPTDDVAAEPEKISAEKETSAAPARDEPDWEKEKIRRSIEREIERETSDRPRVSMQPDQTLRQRTEMQKPMLILGALFLLGVVFFAGSKLPYLKYRLMTWAKPPPESRADKFPGVSSEELVGQAIAAERLGNWQNAVERLVAAKRKNMNHRGLLFRAGKLCYDHGDFGNADKLFERAAALGETVDTANYERALMALARNELPAAEGFLEAAATSNPLVPGYYFKWAETLRRDHHPAEAIRRYEQAGARAENDIYATLCKFKIRQAQMEAGETPKVNSELEQMQQRGPLSVDWVVTLAALHIRDGRMAEAVESLNKAHAADEEGLYGQFASYVGDLIFTNACQNHPEIEEACRVSRPAVSAKP